MGCTCHPFPFPPCPECGKPESATMGSNTWGHEFHCCSDECGLAFASNLKRYEVERDRAKARVVAAQAVLDEWERLLNG